MAERQPTHRERIEALEATLEAQNAAANERLGRVEEVLHQLVVSMNKQGGRRAKRDQSPKGSEGSRGKRRQERLESSSSSSEAFSSQAEESSEGSEEDEEDRRERRGEHERRPRGGVAMPKMDFPKFNGDDPSTWVSRAEQYFEHHPMEGQAKVSYAAYFLEGEANQWWQWMRKTYKAQRKELRWKKFVKELLRRFGSTDYVDYHEALSKIKQLGSLRDYQKEFEHLSTRVHGWTEKALIGSFVGGLKGELAAEVKIRKPKTLMQALEIARMKDDQLRDLRKSSRFEVKKTTPMAAPFGANRGFNKGFTSGGPSGVPIGGGEPPIKGIKKLSWNEMQQRREKGLCFNCDEKFAPGHKCKVKHVYLIEPILEEEETEEEEGHGGACKEEEELNETEHREPHISIHALAGVAGPRTMRTQAHIGKLEVTILIDNGSSLNFINSKVAECLKLPLTKIEPFEVKVASGDRLECRELFKGVCVKMQGIEIVVDLYSLPIVGLDVVLGVQWLEELGKVVSDYKKMSMEFMWGGKWVTLRMNGRVGGRAIGLNEMKKILRHGGGCFAITIASQPRALSEGEGDESGAKGVDLGAEMPSDLREMLLKYSEVMKEPKSLPPSRKFDHRIPLKEEARPVNVAPYRYAYFQKTEIEKQVDEMLANGLIRPSTSPFSSPVLLVKKKDGTWRFCMDYRALNAATVKDRFPIPTIDDMLDELGRSRFFSKLDLRAGYHQIRMHEGDIHKTAFRTHNGHFEYLVMPFGLCNSPSTFQACMNQIFKPFLRRYVLVFFDDILVYSKSWSDHLKHLEEVMRVLLDNSFFIKLSKCAFGQRELEYLGHLISHEGVRVDPKKVKAMVEWPKPKSPTEMRGFLGLTGYYRKFVKDYGSIAKPLTSMLKKNNFRWNEEGEAAFEALKKAMTTTPVLAMPNFEEEFEVHTDASNVGVGAVLTQNGRPLAYISKALGVQKKGWSVYAREMLAILEAVRVWRSYLLGRKFLIVTDQQPLKHLLEQKITTPDQQRWVAKLLGFDFQVMYKPGKENRVADALSRRDDGELLAAISGPSWQIWKDIRGGLGADPRCQEVMEKLEVGGEGVENYEVQNGLLKYKGRVVVPNVGELRKRVMSHFHDSKEGGHSGVFRTWARVANLFFWEGMKGDIRRYVGECDTCQRVKGESCKPKGLMQPLPIPSNTWEDVTMDFIEGLPISNGFDGVLVVVDRLSKYAHFVAMMHPYTAKSIAKLYVDNVMKLHGMPRSIVTDRDRIFMSNFWREFFKMHGTKLARSSTYHPQTDGQSEVTNRTLEQYLRCYVHQYPKQWEEHLSWAEFWYNTSYHRSIKTTPFEVLYGRPAPTLESYEVGSSPNHLVDMELRERDEVLKELKKNLTRAQEQMKKHFDKGRRMESFEPGEWVYLKYLPRKHKVLSKATLSKLRAKYFGPYQILEKCGQLAYKLDLPTGVLIHPIFHVSWLKRRAGDPSKVVNDWPMVDEEGRVNVQPSKVLEYRQVRKGGQIRTEALVQWKGLTAEDATWESIQVLKEQFPELDLEDKVGLEEGRNDEDMKKAMRNAARKARRAEAKKAKQMYCLDGGLQEPNTNGFEPTLKGGI